MPSVARPMMWGPGQTSSRYPKPLTSVKAKPWLPPKLVLPPQRVPTVVDSDWRPELLVKAQEWEAEADRLEVRLNEEDREPDSNAPQFLQIEVDLGLLLVKQDKLNQRLEQQLRDWDRTGDGTVTKGEWRVHIRALGLNHPVAEVDELFGKYDSE